MHAPYMPISQTSKGKLHVAIITMKDPLRFRCMFIKPVFLKEKKKNYFFFLKLDEVH